MGDPWFEFREAFRHDILTRSAQQQFGRSRSRHPALLRFSQPSAVVSFLTDYDSDLDTKDEVCWALVSESQARVDGSSVAEAILFLAFLPSLLKTYGALLASLKKVFKRGPIDEELFESLVPTIAGQFHAQIRKADPASIRRLGATLARNVKRDAWRDLNESLQFTLLRRRPPKNEDSDLWLSAHLANSPDQACISDHEAILGIPTSHPYDGQVAALQSRLAATIGAEDAELLVELLVRGQTAQAFAEERDIKPVTIRKRLERAKARIRPVLEESRRAMSHSTDQVGVLSVEGPNGLRETAHVRQKR